MAPMKYEDDYINENPVCLIAPSAVAKNGSDLGLICYIK